MKAALLAAIVAASMASALLPVNVPFAPSPVGAATFTGNLFYTRYCATPNVKRTTFTYDNVAHTFTVGGQTAIASTNGADGLIFGPNGNLLVGGQGNRVHEVDPNGGGVVGTQTTPDAIFHLSLDPSGTRVYGASIPGAPDAINVPLPAGASSGGTTVSLSGSTNVIDSIAFPPSFGTDGKAFYTSSGAGGNGHIGIITFTSPTVATTAAKIAIPASHSIVYDPFTNTLVAFGSDHVTQLSSNTTSPTVISDFILPGAHFDQGTVDGQGHVYAADNNGKLLFIDYAATGLVGHPSNFSAAPFLDTCLDDVAPLGVTAPPDLSITKSDSPDPVLAGQTLTYTLTVGNATGNAAATGVTVTDALPAGVTFVSATPSQGTCSQSAGTVSCALGGLASSATATVNIQVTPTQAGTITNTVTVGGDQTDPNTSNNSASATTTVIAVTDLSVTKTAAPSPGAIGSPVTYTVNTKNGGPSPATGVTLTDTLPAGATFVSVTPSQGTCTQLSGTVTCSLGNLANGATATTSVVVIPNVTGSLTNVVAVTGNETDPDPSNNQATVTTTVVGFGARGAFVVGDQSATESANFWGAQWARRNSLSGGGAPDAFKGFENSSPIPTCGSTWTTDPGNSANPPASVPSLMAAIVSSSITQAGSTIAGNVAHIVIIRTDPGYAGNPGHEGTGTVVAVVC